MIKINFSFKYNIIEMLTLFCFMLFSACNYNHVKETEINSGNKASQLKIQNNYELTYENIKSNILNKYCLQCHSNTAGNQGNLNLENLQGIKISLDSIYYRSIELKNMPSDKKLNPEEFEIFKNWLEAGAPEVSTGSNFVNMNGKVLNWDIIQSEILRNKCSYCHSSPSPVAGLDLDNYDIFKSKINEVFQKVILRKELDLNANQTPDEAHGGLAPQEKLGILKWISIGMPK